MQVRRQPFSKLGAVQTLILSVLRDTVHHALTLLPLHTAITLSHPFRSCILAQCSVISRRSSTRHSLTNCATTTPKRSILSRTTLLLSKLLQHKTDRCVFPGSFPDHHGLMIFFAVTESLGLWFCVSIPDTRPWRCPSCEFSFTFCLPPRRAQYSFGSTIKCNGYWKSR